MYRGPNTLGISKTTRLPFVVATIKTTQNGVALTPQGRAEVAGAWMSKGACVPQGTHLCSHPSEERSFVTVK